MLEIFINNTPHTLKQELDLQTLLTHLNLSSQGIAIAVNDAVIPKNEWPDHALKNHDKIILIQATQGG